MKIINGEPRKFLGSSDFNALPHERRDFVSATQFKHPLTITLQLRR
ncbi:MAG TPA: hypothetical protein VFY83_03900 [Anaerolineales bacterium]|nr:hypothetical protein [Anaerolineales bacterium]